MAHDFEMQRQGTFESFALMAGEGPLPAKATVAFQFVAEDMAPDWAGAEKALRAAGFITRREEAEGEIEAETGPIALNAAEVWIWEKRATEAVLRFDFWPDGWVVL